MYRTTRTTTFAQQLAALENLGIQPAIAGLCNAIAVAPEKFQLYGDNYIARSQALSGVPPLYVQFKFDGTLVTLLQLRADI